MAALTMNTISADFEELCEKEFNLACKEAYEGLDRDIANIRERMASLGLARSSPMAQAVVDAILARFERVLLSFEKAYLDKWRDVSKTLSYSDYDWLKTKAREKLDPEVIEARARCQSVLWENTLTFIAFWQKAEAEARKGYTKILEKIDILRLQKSQGDSPPMRAVRPAHDSPNHDLWHLLHPTVVKVAKSRFDSGHYADAVEAALKEVNDVVRQIVRDKIGKEYDGADLMNRAFSVEKPVIVLDDLSTMTGRGIQTGYMQIFAGTMTGIRNPKAHSNIQIDSARALHFLFVASLLLSKIDESTKIASRELANKKNVISE